MPSCRPSTRRGCVLRSGDERALRSRPSRGTWQRSAYATCSRKRLRGRESVADQPLSFCMVTTFYPPYHFGGEAMYVYHLSNELARRGHQVTVVHCVDSFEVLTSAPPRGDFPHEPGLTVERLRGPLLPLPPVA